MTFEAYFKNKYGITFEQKKSSCSTKVERDQLDVLFERELLLYRQAMKKIPTVAAIQN